MFAMHLCIYRSLYSIVLSTVESTWGLLMYKCEHLISKSHLVKISISNIGMVNDLLFDILGHIGDTVSHHVTFLCTSPTYSLMFLQIPPIELLQFSPMTLLDPPPQLFVYNADSARLNSGCWTLTGGPGGAMSDSFTSNCLSMEVISSILGFSDFLQSVSTVKMGAQDLCSPIKSLSVILRLSGLWPIVASCQTTEKMASINTQ